MFVLVLVNVEVVVQRGLLLLVQPVIIIELMVKLLKALDMRGWILVKPLFMSLGSHWHDEMQVWSVLIVVNHFVWMLVVVHIVVLSENHLWLGIGLAALI